MNKTILKSKNVSKAKLFVSTRICEVITSTAFKNLKGYGLLKHQEMIHLTSVPEINAFLLSFINKFV